MDPIPNLTLLVGKLKGNHYLLLLQPSSAGFACLYNAVVLVRTDWRHERYDAMRHRFKRLESAPAWTPLQAVTILGAGFIAGAVNTLVGSGSLLPFPALLA